MLSSRCLKETFNILSCLEASQHFIKTAAIECASWWRCFLWILLPAQGPGTQDMSERAQKRLLCWLLLENNWGSHPLNGWWWAGKALLAPVNPSPELLDFLNT